jgi:hypothetical protein
MGGEYVFPIRCRQCGQTQQVEIDLGDLEMLYACDGSSATFDVQLEVDDNVMSTYTVRHITVGDQITLNKRLMKKKSSRKSYTDGDEFIFSLANRIVSIDGVDIKDPEFIVLKLEAMPASQIDALEEGIAAQDFGIRFSHPSECNNCLYTDNYPINITSEFFFRRKDFGAAHRLIGKSI